MNPEDLYKQQTKSRTRKKNKTTLDFINPNNKIIFQYWNQKGFPFTKHRNSESQTTNRAIRLIDKACKKYGKHEIIKAIDTCYNLFTAPWFKYKHKRIGIQGLTLGSFIKYSRQDLMNIKRNNKALYDEDVDSWLHECMIGMPNLQNRFSLILKDEHIETTRYLIDVWKKYNNDDIITTADKNNFIMLSSRLHRLAEVNQKNPDFNMTDSGSMVNSYVVAIDHWLNVWNNKPNILHTGWFLNDIFMINTLPKILVKYGLFNSRTDIRGVKYD